MTLTSAQIDAKILAEKPESFWVGSEKEVQRSYVKREQARAVALARGENFQWLSGKDDRGGWYVCWVPIPQKPNLDAAAKKGKARK